VSEKDVKVGRDRRRIEAFGECELGSEGTVLDIFVFGKGPVLRSLAIFGEVDVVEARSKAGIWGASRYQ
jgi:hypothetical protein